MKRQVPRDKALSFFRSGYNCAQSVLLAMLEYWNIRIDLAPKVASGFGGGIGRCGSVCGALIGGVMAIGIRRGSNSPSAEKRAKAVELSQELYRRFEKRFGTVMCRELVGFDLSQAVQRRRALEAHVFDEKCEVFILSVVEILSELDQGNS